MVPETRISWRSTSPRPSDYMRQPATAISRVAMAATHGSASRSGYSRDTSGVSQSIRRMRDKIILSAAASARHSHSESRRNHICTGARRVLRGSNSAMACPSWPDGAPPFWPAIRGSRECSSRLGNATCIFQSTAERTGTVCMCLGRRIVALTKYVRSQSANTNEHQRMCSISLIPWIIESFDLCIYRPEILPAYVQHDFNTATHPKGRLSHT